MLVGDLLPGLAQQADLLDHVDAEVHHIERGRMHRHLALFELFEGEEIVEHGGELSHLDPDALHVLFHALLLRPFGVPVDQVGTAHDRAQGRAELVAGHAHETRLQRIELALLLQGFAHTALGALQFGGALLHTQFQFPVVPLKFLFIGLALGGVAQKGHHVAMPFHGEMVQAHFHGKDRAVLALAAKVQSRTHGPLHRPLGILGPLARMAVACGIGYEDLDGTSEQFLVAVPEQLAHAGVLEQDGAVRIHDHQSFGRCLEEELADLCDIAVGEGGHGGHDQLGEGPVTRQGSVAAAPAHEPGVPTVMDRPLWASYTFHLRIGPQYRFKERHREPPELMKRWMLCASPR